ncbi:MAG: pentapeptide repeat-containing protein [Planctomycetes bacterium]|nr:pentapeptide repeat-containing protein [Planctomycetota bacterium]
MAIRWETPRGRELKAEVLKDVKERGGDRIAQILEGFMYVSEVPSGRDLRCITWDGEDLEAATFGKVDLSWASLEGSSLERTDLRGATLKRANLSQANLVNAKLDNTDCSRTDFSGSNLEGAHFSEAKMTGAVFLGCNLTRASLSQARCMKCNFLGAELTNTNFSATKVKNANFASGALDAVSVPPDDLNGVFYDLEQEEFEREVGLRAITSRTTKKFKGLDAVLKAQEQLEHLAHKDETQASPGGTRKGPYFGAAPLGTRKFRPGDEDKEHLDFVPRIKPGQQAWGATGSDARPIEGGRRRPPPPPARRVRGGRPAPARRPPARRAAPSDAPSRARPPATPARGHRVSPSAAPASGAFSLPVPGQLQLPIAPFDPAAPEPTADLAKAMGLILQLQPRLTKIVLELGDKSCVVYRQE